MDFIERFFHVTPDGGSGILEAAYVASATAAAAAIVFRRRLAALAKTVASTLLARRA